MHHNRCSRLRQRAGISGAINVAAAVISGCARRHHARRGARHRPSLRQCGAAGASPGRSVDVIAHELMHAELFERVGALRRLIEVPMWFDEGLGMQVDFRSRYNWEEQQSGNNTAFVRQFNSFRQFHQINETQRILNYAAAKVEVAQWLNVVGKQTLFEHFKLVSDGENFDAMLAK